MIIAKEKLTKKFLMDLPYGCYLVSNCHADRLTPIFKEDVFGLEDRAEQWNRIKEVGANNRLCTAFVSEKYYSEYISVLSERVR